MPTTPSPPRRQTTKTRGKKLERGRNTARVCYANEREKSSEGGERERENGKKKRRRKKKRERQNPRPEDEEWQRLILRALHREFPTGREVASRRVPRDD